MTPTLPDQHPARSTPEPSSTGSADPSLSPQAQRARRRALLVIGGIAALLVLLWFGDALSGLVPRGAFHSTTQQAGAYRATLTIIPSQPKAGAPLHATLHIFDGANHPVTNATVTYAWAMVTMDMGTTRGTASASAPGIYNATVTALMGGYWRLTARIHTPNQPDATVSYEVPVQG